ncbi:hypothetical protein CPC08DRAFT_728272 [Agrocybe pediades]|nr:hypothetical protein CPC08DRAFT_728272 [Agrocybe pediades]
MLALFSVIAVAMDGVRGDPFSSSLVVVGRVVLVAEDDGGGVRRCRPWVLSLCRGLMLWLAGAVSRCAVDDGGGGGDGADADAGAVGLWDASAARGLVTAMEPTKQEWWMEVEAAANLEGWWMALVDVDVGGGWRMWPASAEGWRREVLVARVLVRGEKVVMDKEGGGAEERAVRSGGWLRFPDKAVLGSGKRYNRIQPRPRE